MTFRAIDVAGFHPATVADQQRPTLLWVPVADLVIDERYQRALTAPGRRMIQRIADGWDWRLYQPILIASTGDGRHAVVDGQHRAHAAKLAGLDALPAMVVPMTPVEQARAFVGVNRDRIKLHASAVFRAQLAAGEPVAVEADRLVTQAGCRLMTFMRSSATRKVGEIYTHRLILGMVERGEGAAVVAGLRAMRDSEAGQVAQDAAPGLRVYDESVLKPWLTALATSNRFLSLPLVDLFDGIEWEGEIEASRRWCRTNGGAARVELTARVVRCLRAALDARVAA